MEKVGKSIPGTGRRPDMVRLGSALGVAREAGHVWPPSYPGLKAAAWQGWLWCLGGWGLPQLGLPDAGSSHPLPPPASGPPLPSPAQTTDAFQRKLLLILAAIPGHPHPQLALPLGRLRGSKSYSAPQPKAPMGEAQGPPLPHSRPSLLSGHGFKPGPDTD